ncbi:MAG: lipid-A-disaccharide synthase [Elusimicrobiota bacterium]
MSSKRRLLIIAGEVSSDKHGAKLIKEIKNYHDVEITAVGGDMMSCVCDHLEENIVNKAAVGFLEVVKLIPFFLNLKLRITRSYFKSRKRIDGLILIDFPGFNIRVAKAAYKYNIPIFYYITPQVWAWGKSRIKLLSELCKKMYCVFKFEEQLFNKSGGNAEFVGHPILEDIPGKYNIEDFNNKHGIKNGQKVLAVMPGSREGEVHKNIPIIAKALKKCKWKIIIGKAPGVKKDYIQKYLKNYGITSDIYTLLKRADAAVVSSGTSTIEAAILGTPFITIYTVSSISYFIAKLLVNTDFICMVNILAGRKIVPELIQHEFTPDKLKKEVDKLIENRKYRNRMTNDLTDVSFLLGKPGASKKVADSIMQEMEKIS